MRASGGHRIGWSDIPAPVQARVASALGSPVVEAVNQAGGFSPGLAARCRLENGQRVFLKAVSPAQNPQACRIHRREAEVAGRLPPSAPAPQLLDVLDDGEWVVLVFDDVVGRQPTEPWTWDDLDLVVPRLQEIATELTPSPIDGLQTVADRHRPVFDGWRRLAGDEDGAADALPDRVRERVEEFATREADWEPAVEGDTLVHADLRADNLLITEAGQLVLVDWPWACRGAAFVDLVFLLPSIGLGDGPDPVTVADRYGLFDATDPDAVAAVAVAVAGFFLRSSLDPPPPGLPALRAFQRAQADVAVDWVAHLVSPGA